MRDRSPIGREPESDVKNADVGTWFNADNPARIVPLVSNPGDRQFVEEWVDDRGEYETVTVDLESNSFLESDFDLCILDPITLESDFEQFQKRKRNEAPISLPYLLIYPESHPAIRETNGGKVADDVPNGTIDDVLLPPHTDVELSLRVKALLRLRSQSIRMHEAVPTLQQFKQAADAAEHAIYITDAHGTIEYVNSAFERITGYDEQAVLGENFRLLNLGEQTEEYYEDLWECVLSGDRWEADIVNRSKDGGYYHAHQTIAPVTERGRVEGLVAIQSDITKEKDRQASYREERDRVNALFENTQEAIAYVEFEGEDPIVRQVNPAFEEIFDCEEATVVGRSIDDVVVPEDRQDEATNINRRVKAGERLENDVRRLAKDGLRDFVLRSVPLAPGVSGQKSYSIYIDISDRKEYERELELFRTLVNAANDSVYVIDVPSGRFLDVNETACDMMNYDREEFLDLSVSDISTTFDTSQTYREHISGQGNGHQSTIRDGHKRADGTTVPVEISAKTVTIDDRSYRIAIARDITERIDRERELERFERAVENSTDMLAAADTDNILLFANRRYREFHGIDPTDDLSDHSLEDVLSEEEWAEVKSRLESVHRGETVSYDMTRVDQQGDERILDVRYHPLRTEDGSIGGNVATIRDVTESKRLQKDLRETKDRYESLFTSIRDAILVADTNRQIVNCNPAFVELFGYDLEDLEGKPTKYIYETEEGYEAMGDAIEGHIGDPQFTYTVTYEAKSGKTFPGETNVFYLRNADDEIEGFIGVIRDISGRQNRIQQLQIIDRVLQHNFHNDMNVIQGNAQLIRRAGRPPLSTYAELIIETGRELLETVEKEREITDFLSEPPPIDTIHLETTVTRIVEKIQSKNPRASITTRGLDGTRVRASISIEKAIEELLTNSIVHSERDHPTVTIDVSASGDSVTLSVIDENRHIPEMERNVLNDREKLSALYHGSGLGLWLVKLIVNHSDGTLEFERNRPRGNIVRIDLPSA